MKVDKLIEELDWNNSTSVIEKAINELCDISDSELHKLIMPKEKKYWENSAEVICRIGYPRIMVVLDELVIWLQDLNWPGARKIFGLLLQCDKGRFEILIHQTIERAKNEKDEDWIDSIQYLVEKSKD